MRAALLPGVFVPVGANGVITMVGGSGTVVTRPFETKTTGIVFSAASTENTATPYLIYGINL